MASAPPFAPQPPGPEPAPTPPLPPAVVPVSAPDPAPAPGFWAGLTFRGVLVDLAGLGFVGAAIYSGVIHGVMTPEFATFAGLAGFYLGVRSN